MRHVSAALIVVIGLFPVNAAVVVGAGYNLPTPPDIAPGQIITFFVQGMAENLTGQVDATTVPLPASLAGISATLRQGDSVVGPVPILSIKPITPCASYSDAGCGSAYVAITVQIPYGFDVNDPTVIRGVPVSSAEIQFSESGTIAASVEVTPDSDQIHVLRQCDQVLYSTVLCAPIVTHADGTLVTILSPGKSGEQLMIYAFGLGTPKTPVPAGQAPDSAVPTLIQVAVSFDVRSNGLPSNPPTGVVSQPVFAGLVTKYVGLYQINVIVPSLPSGTPLCDSNPNGVRSNLTINIVGHSSFDGALICAQ